MEIQQRLELKIQALKEGFKTKIASTLEEYEDRIADLRIQLTETHAELRQAVQERDDLSARLSELETQSTDAQPEEDEDVQET
jgi:uncharacterized coiled-coil DUF342 family protein